MDLGDVPPASRSHVHCVYKKKLLLCFGGHEQFDTSDMFIFDPKFMKWSKIIPKSNSMPSPRFFASGEILEDYLIIMGGRHGDERKNSMYVFDLVNHTWNNCVESIYEQVGKDARTLVQPLTFAHISNPTEQQFQDYHERRMVLMAEAEAKAEELLRVDSSDINAFTNQYRYLYHLLPMKRTGNQCCVVGPKKKLIMIAGALRNEIKIGDVWEIEIQSRSFLKQLPMIRGFYDMMFMFQEQIL